MSADVRNPDPLVGMRNEIIAVFVELSRAGIKFGALVREVKEDLGEDFDGKTAIYGGIVVLELAKHP